MCYPLIFAAVGIGLYLLWGSINYFHKRNRKSKTKAKYDAGEAGLCRYGVNASGEITRVRAKYLRSEK
jgi:hypothetical protein